MPTIFRLNVPVLWASRSCCSARLRSASKTLRKFTSPLSYKLRTWLTLFSAEPGAAEQKVVEDPGLPADLRLVADQGALLGVTGEKVVALRMG